MHTHRDPLKVVASLTSLIGLLRSMATDHIDSAAIGIDWTERLARGLSRATATRAHGLPRETQVIDIHYRDFVGNEIATIRRIYDTFGIPFTQAAEAGMRLFLTANPATKHGVHRYTLAHAKLDVETERRRYAWYMQRYGVAAEAA